MGIVLVVLRKIAGGFHSIRPPISSPGTGHGIAAVLTIMQSAILRARRVEFQHPTRPLILRTFTGATPVAWVLG